MLNREEYSIEAQKIVNYVQNYFNKIESYPVRSQVSPREIYNSFAENAPSKGKSTQEILDIIDSVILPGITHWQHPNFHGYFTANSSVESVLAETITSAFSAQCMLWATSPAATELEERVLDWLWVEMGLGVGWKGVIHDTASTATFSAIITAREKACNFTSNIDGVPNNLRVYCSTQTHSSIEKGVAMAGIGTRNLVKIPVDENMAMRVDLLKAAISIDLDRGYKPCCVISALGTTGTVAIDPITEISEVCIENEVWHHVDAAYAGTALLLPEFEGHRKGISEADSFVFNPHKWLFTNFDCTAYYVKDVQALLRTFTINPEYLRTPEDTLVNNYKDWGVQLGRRFRALKLWWVLQSYGMDNIREKLRSHVRLMQFFTESIQISDDFRLYTIPVLNFCTFQWVPESNLDDKRINDLNEKLMKTINAGGKAFLSHTVIENNYLIRVVIGQTYVEKRHIENLLHIIYSTAAEIWEGEKTYNS